MKIQYVKKRFNSGSRAIISQATEILTEYAQQGFQLTLRQLYYQFVSRDLIEENSQKEYKRIGAIISDARLAGLVDWDSIVDRTRNLITRSRWSDPAQIAESCVSSFHMDRWKGQGYRPEVWIEKDALIGVIERVCREYDVPYFSCRGYTSQSEMHEAAKRLQGYSENGQTPIVIHLGDHDPSGKDMTRDIDDRLELFTHERGIDVKRIALNMDQVKKYNPPPNPAKITDARASKYIDKFGDESWELDALSPQVIEKLIKDQVIDLIDPDPWDNVVKTENEGKAKLRRMAQQLAD